MRIPSALIVSAALCLGALPAAAEVHQLGAVNVSADKYTHVSWSRFDGPVSRLAFVPETDAIDCSHVTIHYRDGTSYDVFSGTVLKDQRQTILFPANEDNRVRDVDFACKAQNVDGARVALFAVSEGDRPAYGDDDRPARVQTHEDASGIGR